jgi:hypothetical protein
MAKNTEESEFCQYYYKDMIQTAFPDTRLALPVRKYWFLLKRYVWYTAILGPTGFVSRILPTTKLGKFALKNKQTASTIIGTEDNLNLQPGDWVEVRSVKEIFATLDAQGKLKGLRFTPEMMKFCGKRLRVYKLLGKIILEATGELRKIKTPTVLLENSFCDGSAHAECDRSCFCFWREQWLKCVPTGNVSDIHRKMK